MLDKAIGIFDSGLGGISVLKDMVHTMPNEHFIYYGDSKNAPYGTKTKEEIIKNCDEIFNFFLEKNVKAIVIACNTATSAAASFFRKKYPDMIIVGMEPALKLATQNKKNKNIIVMATQLTLREEKFKILMKNYSGDNNIITMPCPQLVEIVESGMLDKDNIAVNQIKEYYKNYNIQEIDSIVLGCTHFIFFRKYIRDIFGNNINIIDGNIGTANNLKFLLEHNNILSNKSSGLIEFYNSSKDKNYIKLSQDLFNRNDSILLRNNVM